MALIDPDVEIPVDEPDGDGDESEHPEVAPPGFVPPERDGD